MEQDHEPKERNSAIVPKVTPDCPVNFVPMDGEELTTHLRTESVKSATAMVTHQVAIPSLVSLLLKS